MNEEVKLEFKARDDKSVLEISIRSIRFDMVKLKPKSKENWMLVKQTYLVTSWMKAVKQSIGMDIVIPSFFSKLK